MSKSKRPDDWKWNAKIAPGQLAEIIKYTKDKVLKLYQNEGRFEEIKDKLDEINLEVTSQMDLIALMRPEEYSEEEKKAELSAAMKRSESYKSFYKAEIMGYMDDFRWDDEHKTDAARMILDSILEYYLTKTRPSVQMDMRLENFRAPKILPSITKAEYEIVSHIFKQLENGALLKDITKNINSIGDALKGAMYVGALHNRVPESVGVMLLSRAIINGRVDVMEALRDRGVDLMEELSNRRTMLFCVVKKKSSSVSRGAFSVDHEEGKRRVMELLLRGLGDDSKRAEYLQAKDLRGENVLIYAAVQGDLGALDLILGKMLELGMNIDQISEMKRLDRLNAVDVAAENDNFDAVMLLLERGVVPGDAQYALLKAAEKGRNDIIHKIFDDGLVRDKKVAILVKSSDLDKDLSQARRYKIIKALLDSDPASNVVINYQKRDGESREYSLLQWALRTSDVRLSGLLLKGEFFDKITDEELVNGLRLSFKIAHENVFSQECTDAFHLMISACTKKYKGDPDKLKEIFNKSEIFKGSQENFKKIARFFVQSKESCTASNIDVLVSLYPELTRHIDETISEIRTYGVSKAVFGYSMLSYLKKSDPEGRGRLTFFEKDYDDDISNLSISAMNRLVLVREFDEKALVASIFSSTKIRIDYSHVEFAVKVAKKVLNELTGVMRDDDAVDASIVVAGFVFDQEIKMRKLKGLFDDFIKSENSEIRKVLGQDGEDREEQFANLKANLLQKIFGKITSELEFSIQQHELYGALNPNHDEISGKIFSVLEELGLTNSDAYLDNLMEGHLRQVKKLIDNSLGRKFSRFAGMVRGAVRSAVLGVEAKREDAAAAVTQGGVVGEGAAVVVTVDDPKVGEQTREEDSSEDEPLISAGVESEGEGVGDVGEGLGDAFLDEDQYREKNPAAAFLGPDRDAPPPAELSEEELDQMIRSWLEEYDDKADVAPAAVAAPEPAFEPATDLMTFDDEEVGVDAEAEARAAAEAEAEIVKRRIKEDADRSYKEYLSTLQREREERLRQEAAAREAVAKAEEERRRQEAAAREAVAEAEAVGAVAEAEVSEAEAEFELPPTAPGQEDIDAANARGAGLIVPDAPRGGLQGARSQNVRRSERVLDRAP